MEDYVFERDYSDKEEVNLKLNTPDIFDDTAETVFSRLNSLFLHRIIPEGKQTFERLVAMLDKIAQENYGKIRAIIDCRNFQSVIDLYIPFYEFCNNEYTTELIKYIANSKDVHCAIFEPASNDQIKLNLLIEYFEDIIPEDRNELYKHYLQIADELDAEGPKYKELSDSIRYISAKLYDE